MAAESIADQAVIAYRKWIKEHFDSPDAITSIPEEAFKAGYEAGREDELKDAKYQY